MEGFPSRLRRKPIPVAASPSLRLTPLPPQRIVLDTHPYVAFGGDFDHPLSYWPQAGCVAYGNNQSQMDFGITISGEWSGAINNCGKWVLSVGQNSTYPDCPMWDAWPSWTADMKTGIKNFIMSQMDAMALPGYFFWTWKVGNSSVTGKVEAPFWSYKLGLDNGTSSLLSSQRLLMTRHSFLRVGPGRPPLRTRDLPVPRVPP